MPTIYLRSRVCILTDVGGTSAAGVVQSVVNCNDNARVFAWYTCSVAIQSSDAVRLIARARHTLARTVVHAMCNIS